MSYEGLLPTAPTITHAFLITLSDVAPCFHPLSTPAEETSMPKTRGECPPFYFSRPCSSPFPFLFLLFLSFSFSYKTRERSGNKLMEREREREFFSFLSSCTSSSRTNSCRGRILFSLRKQIVFDRFAAPCLR